MAKEKLRYAKNYKCRVEKCKKKAVVFWPIVDPDIPEYPYCRKHVEEAKMRVIMEFAKHDIKI